MPDKTVFGKFPDMNKDQLLFSFQVYKDREKERRGGGLRGSLAAVEKLVIDDTEFGILEAAKTHIRTKAKPDGEAIAVRVTSGPGVDPQTKQQRKHWLLGAKFSGLIYDPGL